MNKTIDALKLAEEASNRVIETLEYLKTIGIHSDSLAPAIRAEKKALAAIREALAEPVKQEPVACPNLQPVINWLENGCDPKEAAKELRIYQEQMKAAPVSAPKQEPVAVISESAIGLVKLHSNGACLPFGTQLYAAPVEPVKQEPVIDLSKIRHEDKCCYWDDEAFCDCGADSHEILKWYRKNNAAPVQPVKQKPVGEVDLHKELGQLRWMGGDEGWDNAINAVMKRLEELYAAPVDAKAIRAEERQRCIEAIRKAHHKELCDVWDCIEVIKELE